MVFVLTYWLKTWIKNPLLKAHCFVKLFGAFIQRKVVMIFLGFFFFEFLVISFMTISYLYMKIFRSPI